MTIADKLIRAKTDYDKVYEAGKQAEYDAFWDEYQENGNRTKYEGAFYGNQWTNKTFRPKYDIITKGSAVYMFYMLSKSTDVIDLFEWFKSLGITLDTSGATNASYMFSYAQVSRIPVLDFTSVTTFERTFRYSTYLTTIDKIILKNDGSQSFGTGCFEYCNSLTDITFEGVIGKSISFKDSPLTKASFTNVIEHLSSTASGQTATFKKTAKEEAFTADEWATLIATKSNWTISLV